MHVRSVFALCALAAVASPLAAERWKTQYLFDEPKSTLVIQDLQFPSAKRGVAVGSIMRGKRAKHVALTTSDGGEHWQTTDLKEEPVSLFFLNENLGWMVTTKGLWKTREAGKQWEKLPKLRERAVRVYFIDEDRGWAACEKKTVLATTDGGKHWTPLEAASREPGDPDTTTYDWIAFASPEIGLITGWNTPPRPQRFPEWMDPASAVNRRETPHVSISLETHDGGKTWRSTSASTFGDVVRLRFGPPGKGLGLVEHSVSFEYPSEVHQILWPSGKAELLFRDRTFFVTDVWVTKTGTYYLAGTTGNSRLRNVVPQKVRVVKSVDGKRWTLDDVDYRAVANRVMLAGPGDGNLWMATNNGMILKLEP